MCKKRKTAALSFANAVSRIKTTFSPAILQRAKKSSIFFADHPDMPDKSDALTAEEFLPLYIPAGRFPATRLPAFRRCALCGAGTYTAATARYRRRA